MANSLSYTVAKPAVTTVGNSRDVVKPGTRISSWSVRKLTNTVTAYLRFNGGDRIRIVEGDNWAPDNPCDLPDNGLTLDVEVADAAGVCEIYVGHQAPWGVK